MRDTTILATQTLETVTLQWGRDEMITLPEGTEAVRLTIDKIDGTRRVITDTESRDAWFDVVVDPERRQLVIRPADLDSALR